MADEGEPDVPEKVTPREMMQQFTPGQLVSLGIIVLASLALIGSIFYYANREELAPLFGERLDAKTQKQIEAELILREVHYEVSSKGRIMVPMSKVLELQTDFEAMDILPSGKSGMNLMDETNPLKAGEFMMRLKSLYALSVDLERRLEENPFVMKAEVKIVPAKDSPFADESSSAKASVMLRLKTHTELNNQQVMGMQRSVSSAIEGADLDDVTITDQYYNLLSRPPSDDTAAGVSNTNLEVKARMERDLERKIHQIVETFLGRGKAKARVSMDVDFDQISTVEKRYGGVDAEGEPQRYSEQNKNETIARDGNAGNAVGTAANTAQGAVPVAGQGTNASNIQRNTQTNQYFVDELQTSTQHSPYDVERISVALQLDYKTVEKVEGQPTFFAKLTTTNPDWIKTSYEPLTQDELARIRGLVEAAIGYQAPRGDNISIQNFEFRPMISKKAAATMETGGLLDFVREWSIPVLQLIVFILFVMWGISLFRRFVAPILQQAQLEEPALSAALPSGPPKTVAELESELEQEIEATSPSAQLSKSEIMKKRLMEMVQQDPDSVAGLVRTWLLEDD